ncbi:antibiotic biosynthesis monooxygenase family protein [Sphingobacterium sp. GVS05A]|uniref:antibiotic biosynthesis monooxygenase family protein n=1 Tax=Sphingobacterium sp. GVS05A TaxID=2862679 RepID=UPI001CBF5CF6|nr:antibiotic biosynthesis monooxygenase family protein [Sphingobacterium sp. GVS05A]
METISYGGMKNIKSIVLIIPILMALKTLGQNKNQQKMEQVQIEERSITEKCAVIDKITIPAKAIEAYTEKAAYIRNIIRHQPGFIKYEIFQSKSNSGELKVITIATWKNGKYLDNARLVIKEIMKQAGINMPNFLEENSITMERDIFIPIEE